MERFGIVERIGLVKYVDVTMNYTCSCELDFNFTLYNILVLMDTMFELCMHICIYVIVRFEFFGGKMYCRGGSI